MMENRLTTASDSSVFRWIGHDPRQVCAPSERRTLQASQHPRARQLLVLQAFHFNSIPIEIRLLLVVVVPLSPVDVDASAPEALTDPVHLHHLQDRLQVGLSLADPDHGASGKVHGW